MYERNPITFDFFEKRRNSELVSHVPLQLPPPDEKTLNRQDRCIANGFEKMLRRGEYGAFAIDCPRLRSCGTDPLVARLDPERLGEHDGNWGVIAFRSYMRTPGWVYAVSAAELLIIAGCEPEGIDRILCIDAEDKYLSKLTSHGIPFLYIDGGSTEQLLPKETYTMRLPVDRIWNVQWDRLKADNERFPFWEEMPESPLSPCEYGLRLNLEPRGEQAAMYIEFCKRNLAELEMQMAAAEIAGIYENLPRTARRSSWEATIPLALVPIHYQALCCGKEDPMPFLLQSCAKNKMDSQHKFTALSAVLSTTRELLDLSGNKMVSMPKGGLLLPPNALVQELSDAYAKIGRVRDIVRLWIQSLDEYDLTFASFPEKLFLKVNCDKHVAYMRKVADLLSLEPALNAILADVPADDVFA